MRIVPIQAIPMGVAVVGSGVVLQQCWGAFHFAVGALKLFTLQSMCFHPLKTLLACWDVAGGSWRMHSRRTNVSHLAGLSASSGANF